MSAWAKPGVQCVCVDAAWHPWRQTPRIEGAVYTVDRVGAVGPDDWSDATLDGACTIGLLEIENPDNSDGMFASTRFRPMATETQDVALFRQILADLPLGEDA